MYLNQSCGPGASTSPFKDIRDHPVYKQSVNERQCHIVSSYLVAHIQNDPCHVDLSITWKR